LLSDELYWNEKNLISFINNNLKLSKMGEL
jgi:hypothetical protein